MAARVRLYTRLLASIPTSGSKKSNPDGSMPSCQDCLAAWAWPPFAIGGRVVQRWCTAGCP
eukprot:8828417-Pyramimonas_sp.AAC.1